MKSIESVIERTINDTLTFLESSVLTINNNTGEALTGWPHYHGKQRLTEYGGTSSGLSALFCYEMPNAAMREIADTALTWLINQQNEDGSWKSSGGYNCETTAGIIIDLYEHNVLPRECIEKACRYIKSCYDVNGYFKATPLSTRTPHLFITYRAVLALVLTNHLEKSWKSQIISWVQQSRSIDHRWGMAPKCLSGTLSHTILALLIFHYCDMPLREMGEKYKAQIKWLKTNIVKCGYMYETETIDNRMGKDEYGYVYDTLVTTHFIGPYMCHLLDLLGETKLEMNALMSITESQSNGGWGPSKDKITLWATQQAIYQLNRFKKNKLDRLNILEKLFYRIPYGLCKAVISIVIILVSCWLFFNPAYRDDAIVALLLAVVPWLFKRR